jgi:hypothetical protein
MLGNVAIDAMIGAVPLIGDLFDFAWKANEMNLALLEKHAAAEWRPASGDWLFAAALTVVVLLVAAVPFALTFLFAWTVVSWLR